MTLTESEKMRLTGFKANLRVRGRAFSTDSTESVLALVEDIPILADSDKPMQAKLPVYVNIACLAGALKDPRAIGTFTEVETTKVYTVIKYNETASDRVTWKFLCEAQREDHAADEE